MFSSSFQPLPKGRWNNDDDEDEDDATLARKGARNATDIARARLDKLMKNPAKPVRELNAKLKLFSKHLLTMCVIHSVLIFCRSFLRSLL